jgi:hypothetical protein
MYMKALEISAVPPVVIPHPLNHSTGCKPWTIIKSLVGTKDMDSKPVASPISTTALTSIAENGWSTLQEKRHQRLLEELSVFEELRSTRKADKEKRLTQNILRDILEKQSQEIEELSKVDTNRRPLTIVHDYSESLRLRPRPLRQPRQLKLPPLHRLMRLQPLKRKRKPERSSLIVQYLETVCHDSFFSISFGTDLGGLVRCFPFLIWIFTKMQ